ncbi:MAG TPA: SgcJ/EcaC family oxidoreductase [Gemmatimonadales bacterium]|nr:SgcJ/EcaC family oxidoreductase [Gemmatimonadales bacterium]
MTFLTRQVSTLAGLGAVAALLAAAPAVAQGIPKEHTPLEPTTAQIERLRSAYRDAWNKKDAHAVAMLYTQDAILIDAGGAMFQGRSQIEAHFKPQASGWQHLESTSTYTKRLGDWGWQVGTTRIGTVQGDQKADIAGRYLVILANERGVVRIRAMALVNDTSATQQMRTSSGGTVR